ncbi:MAG: minor capsid protein [Oscillospiraceae bacterium]|nr:minor capsid protein [Oscillospiraceae bacterium]
MNLSRQIPKALLPHNIVLLVPKTTAEYIDGASAPTIFNDDFSEIAIHNVRFEQNEKVRQTKSGDSRTRGARVYYDCVNSFPQDVKFTTEQLLVFAGQTYKIEAVRAVVAAEKIHHYRIEVI